ncbi:MAG: glycosyl hydrolase 53 family protein [Terracidiphilus sp.]
MPHRISASVAVLLLVAGIACPAQPTPVQESSKYAIGADISFLLQAEQQGAVFKENGIARPALDILRDHGYNWIRLRIFNSPSTLPNNLDYTLAAAKRARAMGFRFLLDFHYADDWADPGHQPTPAAWKELNHKQLTEAVFAYTRDTIATFREPLIKPSNSCA